MFPQRKYIPDQYKEKCDFQSWEGVKVVPGLAEGRGVFSTKTFSRGSIICNYGGLNVTESYAEKHMLPYEEQCNYLVELREKTCDGASVKVFVNFDPGKEKTFRPASESFVCSCKCRAKDIFVRVEQIGYFV